MDRARAAAALASPAAGRLSLTLQLVIADLAARFDQAHTIEDEPADLSPNPSPG